MDVLAEAADERVVDVRFDDAGIIVDLMDGRTIAVRSLSIRAFRRRRPSSAGVGNGGCGLCDPLAGDR